MRTAIAAIVLLAATTAHAFNSHGGDVDGNRAIACSGNDGTAIYQLDGPTVTLRKLNPAASGRSCVLSGGTAYVGRVISGPSTSWAVAAYNADTLAQLWSVPSSTSPRLAMTSTGLVVASGSQVRLLHPATGATVTQATLPNTSRDVAAQAGEIAVLTATSVELYDANLNPRRSITTPSSTFGWLATSGSRTAASLSSPMKLLGWDGVLPLSASPVYYQSVRFVGQDLYAAVTQPQQGVARIEWPSLAVAEVMPGVKPESIDANESAVYAFDAFGVRWVKNLGGAVPTATNSPAPTNTVPQATPTGSVQQCQQCFCTGCSDIQQ